MSFRLLAASAAIASLALTVPALAGNPVSGVGVSVEASPGGMAVASGTTDRAGMAAPKGVRAGTYRLALTGAGGKTVTAVVKNGATALETLNATCPAEGKCTTGVFRVPDGAALSITVTGR